MTLEISENLYENCDSEISQVVLLANLPDRKIFLTETSIYLIIYVLPWVLTTMFCNLQPELARYIWNIGRFNYLIYPSVLLSILIKIAASLFSASLRKVMALLFWFDVVLSKIAFFGALFKFEFQNLDGHELAGNVPIILAWVIMSSYLGFLLSTMINKPVLHYDSVMGFLLMAGFNFITFGACKLFGWFYGLSFHT